MTANNWIPVTERLPKKDGRYLVVKSLCGKTQWQDVLSFAKDGTKVSAYELAGETNVWYFYDSEYGHIPTNNVTHWMPLPEMPELPEGE